jgi:L-ascorbate metabolism protein UlaG (beta-lactamase superfamily)
MTLIRRLSDSTVLVRSDEQATLFDPGFHSFTSGVIDLESIGDVTRVMITHEHRDHVSPDFISWLRERRADLVVHANQTVVDILASTGIAATTDVPADVKVEDVLHERVASGATPPNRSFTIEGLFTHPGDSRQPSHSGPVLALPLIVPWDSTTGAVEFARRLGPRQVIPIHDFYLDRPGRDWVAGMVKAVLAEHGIELVELDWGDSYTV